MRSFVIIFSIFFAFVAADVESESCNVGDSLGEALYLTSYIENGDIETVSLFEIWWEKHVCALATPIEWENLENSQKLNEIN